MYTPEFRAAVVSEYESGANIAALHRKHGVSEPTITKWLKSAGVTIRRTNGRELHLDHEEVNRLYKSGKSTYEIARLFSCTSCTVSRLIDDIRPMSERNRHNKDTKTKISAASKCLWQDPEYVSKVQAGTGTPQYKAALSTAAKKHRTLANWVASEHGRAAISAMVQKRWSDPEYRRKQAAWAAERTSSLVAALRDLLADPVRKRAWADKLRCSNAARRTNVGWVSTSQKQFYYMLESSGVEYREEGQDTRVGPFYVVDCIIPKQQDMARDLVVEIQGEYWHSMPHVELKDRQKRTYIERHTEYDLLCLDELNLKSFQEVAARLKEYGISLCETRCEVSELQIRRIPESEAQLFYSVFHYTSTVRKGADTYGAFLNDELVAAISYTFPIRVETASSLGFDRGEVLEISRLARKTNLVCPNLMSYLIGRSRSLLDSRVRCVVSFSDSTQGHTGGVYKACGFVRHSETTPDYCYGSMLGRYHKKTIWDRAKRMKMSEAEYAEKHGLVRITTKPKTKWVYTVK